MSIYKSAIDAIRDRAISPSKVTTVDLDIDGNDLVAAGDVVQLASYNAAKDVRTSVSGTSYSFGADERDALEAVLKWDDTIPNGATGVISLSAALKAGTDETLSARMKEQDGGSGAEVSTTSTSFVTISSGWVSFSPSSPSSAVRYRIQFKTSNGVNSGTIAGYNFGVGVSV